MSPLEHQQIEPGTQHHHHDGEPTDSHNSALQGGERLLHLYCLHLVVLAPLGAMARCSLLRVAVSLRIAARYIGIAPHLLADNGAISPKHQGSRYLLSDGVMHQLRHLHHSLNAHRVGHDECVGGVVCVGDVPMAATEQQTDDDTTHPFHLLLPLLLP